MTSFDEKKELETESATIDNPEMKSPGLTKRLFIVAVMGVLGNSLPTGYNIGVINTPQTMALGLVPILSVWGACVVSFILETLQILEQFCNKSLAQREQYLTQNELGLLWSFIVSIYLGSAAVGSLCASFLADKFGRRQTLLLNNSIGLISAAFFAFSEVANSVELLFLGRLTVGFYSGLGSSVGPMYLMEVAPTHLRGSLGVLHQLGLTLGILISQILGQQELLGTEMMWPVLLSLYSVSIAIALLLLPFCPECPAYIYINQNNTKKALHVLVKLRNRPIEYLQEDISLLKKEQKEKESTRDWTMWTILKDPTVRPAALLLCAMHAGQQLIGISAIFYYSTSTFEKVGMNIKQSQYGSIGTGMMNFVMACIAVPLMTRCRRRTLMLLSLIAGSVFLVVFTIAMVLQDKAFLLSYISIIALISFVCVYGLGMGPIPYMIGSELLLQGPRAAGMSLGCAVNWFSNFIVAMCFPVLQNLMKEYIFLVFSSIGLLLAVYIYFYLPETRGLNPIQVSKKMEKKFSQQQTSYV